MGIWTIQVTRGTLRSHKMKIRLMNLLIEILHCKVSGKSGER